MEMGFRWDFAYKILPDMLWATLNTIIAAGVGYAIALVVGLFFLLGQRTPDEVAKLRGKNVMEIAPKGLVDAYENTKAERKLKEDAKS